jgi:hypothetical protein
MAKLSWSDMATGQKVATVLLGTVQFALAALAWSDLAKRTANEVNGPKKVWAAVIAVNWVGPIAYFIKGRRLDG